MKTKNKVRTALVLFIISVIITVITSVLHIREQVYLQSDAYSVNVVRAYTSVIINLVEEDYPNINETVLEEQLEELEMTALVIDLEGTVLYNNTSFSAVSAMRDLNQTHPYVYNGVAMVKASFHITDETGIKGFIIFGIPEEVLVEESNNTLLILLILEVGLSIFLILNLRNTYKKTILDPIKKLNNALLDVSNGIYNTLQHDKDSSIKSFTNYNIMLDQMERTLRLQTDYQQSRKQLIANISHEIRTPLTYVRLSAELLEKNDCLDETNRKYIETILNKISAIDAIIEDLFRYSKQDLDKLLIVLKEKYSKDLFDRIFTNIELKNPDKHIIITMTNNIPNVIINVDEDRLVQVVSNLVDNAEKHIDDQGFINIRTEMEENHLILTVEDSGDGISPKDLPYIFEPFYQGEQEDHVKKKGSGLGLAICEYIITKHNGEIFVYSELNKGTKFVIKFQEII